MGWNDGTELPEDEIECLCRLREPPFKYKILKSIPDSSIYAWDGNGICYQKDEIMCWCPVDEVNHMLMSMSMFSGSLSEL